MFVVGNSNGLMASSATHRGPQTTRPYYLVDDGAGNATVDGDLTVAGTLFVDTIEPISTTEPVYIRAPNELGGDLLANSGLVVEGGANRSDISSAQVSIATYKPLTRGTIDYGQGEQVGSLSMWGKDTSGNDTKYVDVRGVITNPTNGAEESRLNLVLQKAGVALTLLQLDTSENVVKTLTNTQLQAGGNIIGLADISCNGDVYVGDDLFVGDDVNCADVLATASVQANRAVILGTTVPSALAGIAFRVDGVDAGRTNHDSINMNITGLTGTASAVQQICGTQVASRAIKDASNNITMTIGSSIAPNATLQLSISGETTVAYEPSRMKATSAISSGSTVSFTNSAEILTNSSVVASRTGYYQFIAQFRTDAIGTFDAGTDIISFYADISGGSLTPLIGSIHDITYTTATTFEYTFSGYAFATAGDTINLIHIDTGTFTMTNAVLFVLWNYIGPGTGLV